MSGGSAEFTTARVRSGGRLPVVIAPLLARGWRLTWAGRAGVLAVGFFALAVFGIHDTLPFRLPELGVEAMDLSTETKNVFVDLS